MWAAFDKVLLGEFHRVDGLTMKIERTFIDMGHKDRRVLGFCSPRVGRGIYPCRGINRPGLNTPPLLPAKPSTNNKARIPHWNIGVTVAKTAIYDRLMLPVGEARSMHFPRSYKTEYFKQLTAEKRRTKFQFGKKYFIFEKANNAVRNEALDLNVYALAALHSLAPIHWAMLAANLKKRAIVEERARAAQMVAEAMKSKEVVKPNAGILSDSEPPAIPSDPASRATAEMNDSGHIEPAAPPAPILPQTPQADAPVRPTPAHWRKANGRRPGFASRW